MFISINNRYGMMSKACLRADSTIKYKSSRMMAKVGVHSALGCHVTQHCHSLDLIWLPADKYTAAMARQENLLLPNNQRYTTNIVIMLCFTLSRHRPAFGAGPLPKPEDDVVVPQQPLLLFLLTKTALGLWVWATFRPITVCTWLSLFSHRCINNTHTIWLATIVVVNITNEIVSWGTYSRVYCTY